MSPCKEQPPPPSPASLRSSLGTTRGCYTNPVARVFWGCSAQQLIKLQGVLMRLSQLPRAAGGRRRGIMAVCSAGTKWGAGCGLGCSSLLCHCPHVEGGRRLSGGSGKMETWACPLGQEGRSGSGEKRSALGNVERGSLYFQGSPVHLPKGDQQSGGDGGEQGHGWCWEQMAGRVTSVARLSGPIIPPDGPPALLPLPAPGRGC